MYVRPKLTFVSFFMFYFFAPSPYLLLDDDRWLNDGDHLSHWANFDFGTQRAPIETCYLERFDQNQRKHGLSNILQFLTLCDNFFTILTLWTMLKNVDDFNFNIFCTSLTIQTIVNIFTIAKTILETLGIRDWLQFFPKGSLPWKSLSFCKG